MTQIGLLIQMSIDRMLRVILIAFTTKSVLIARNSKLACETSSCSTSPQTVELQHGSSNQKLAVGMAKE